MEEDKTLYVFVSEALDESSLGPRQDDLKSDINAQDESGNTLLHKAILKESNELVDMLLSKDIGLEIMNDNGETPLMVAVKLGNEILVEKLIRNGANVDSEDDYYNTPLLQAVKLNYEHIVDLLLKNGASCSVENKSSETPIHLAVHNDFESILDKLIKAGADLNVATAKYGTLIQVALTAVNLRIARKLLSNGVSLCSSSVFYSLLNCYKKNFVTLFDFILENGFDVNAKGCENWSLLHLAVIRQNVKVVDNLLKKKVNVNARDNNRETPLHCAVRISDCSIVKLLLEHKSNVNAKDVNGLTALHIAVMSYCAECVRLLLNAGADMSAPNNHAVNPFCFMIFPSKKVTSYMLCARKMNLAKVRICLNQNDGTRPKNFKYVETFDSKCLEELDHIKAKKFGGTSLYQIFSKCCDPVFSSCSDMEVYVNSDTLKCDFPLYAFLLRKKFKEGKRRNILLNELSLSVRIIKGVNVTHIVLPKEMSRKVLVYLDDCDLLNVKKAFLHQ